MAQLDVEAVPLFMQDLPLLAQQGFAVGEWDAKAMAVFGLAPIEALARSMETSAETSAVFVNEELVAIWGHGYREFVSGVGYAWLVTTPAIAAYRLRFALNAHRIIEYLMSIYSRLEVVVDAEFLQSVEWMKRMGFSSHPAAILQRGHPFMFMWKDR